MDLTRAYSWHAWTAIKGRNSTERATRPASAPASRKGSQSARGACNRNVASPTTPAATRSPTKSPTSGSANAAQFLDGLQDVETLRAEFGRLVAEREKTAAKAVEEMEAAVSSFFAELRSLLKLARARALSAAHLRKRCQVKSAKEKENELEQQMAAATARCQELEAENGRLRYLLIWVDLAFAAVMPMCRLVLIFVDEA